MLNNNLYKSNKFTIKFNKYFYRSFLRVWPDVKVLGILLHLIFLIHIKTINRFRPSSKAELQKNSFTLNIFLSTFIKKIFKKLAKQPMEKEKILYIIIICKLSDSSIRIKTFKNLISSIYIHCE